MKNVAKAQPSTGQGGSEFNPIHQSIGAVALKTLPVAGKCFQTPFPNCFPERLSATPSAAPVQQAIPSHRHPRFGTRNKTPFRFGTIRQTPWPDRRHRSQRQMRRHGQQVKTFPTFQNRFGAGCVNLLVASRIEPVIGNWNVATFLNPLLNPLLQARRQRMPLVVDQPLAGDPFTIKSK